MKKASFFLILLGIVFSARAQITEWPSVDNTDEETRIMEIRTSLDETIITLGWSRGGWVKISPETRLEYRNLQNGKKENMAIVKMTREGGSKSLQLGKMHCGISSVSLHFPKLPNGVEKINLIEPGGWEFIGINITEVSNEPMKRLASSETELKRLIDSSNYNISGFYEKLEGHGYKLAVYQAKDSVYLIYTGHDLGNVGSWQFGEVKAVLKPTVVKNIFKADWYGVDKIRMSAVVTFEGASMSIKVEHNSPDVYFKMGEKTIVDSASGEKMSERWTGTGFAIGAGYLVTNNHVAGDAKKISIKGIHGDINKGYNAEVVANDKVNDIAVLKISDSSFRGFGTIPYTINFQMADVGEDVMVLGFPLTQALGNEIKLTNGIISSRTGFQGDISTYQISAPVQPGNSGGPMFDSKGNVIGIVVAGVPGAENVGYAIKISYLKILIESAGLNITFPANNTISTLSLAEKVKRVKNFVFYIECSNK